MTRPATILTSRQECCVRIATLFTLNRRREAFTLLKNRYRPNVIPTLFLEELFIHLSLVLGFPAMLEGLEFVKRARPGARQHRTKRPLKSGESGERILRRIYGRQSVKLLSNIGEIHPDARSMIVRDVYGKVFSRTGLKLSERELINVTVLALQGLDRQLYSHLRGCIRVGIGQNAMKHVLSLIQKYSNRNMEAARTLLRMVVSQKKKL